jgi:hypothetical protein
MVSNRPARLRPRIAEPMIGLAAPAWVGGEPPGVFGGEPAVDPAESGGR